MSDRTSGGRICLSDLDVEAFVSPLDQKALANLQRLPLLPILIRKFNEMAVDEIWYAMNSSETVRCGPRQFRTLYGLMREACSILHVPEPELYVRYDSRVNAMTAGVGRPFVVVHSALIEGFTDEEILYILGHEIGHIKCGHVLYQMLAMTLLLVVRVLGQSGLAVGQLATLGLAAAFYEWLRNAEFSADRAGLLVCQDPKVAYTATMKLGCGHTRFSHEMDLEVFMEQAREHAKEPGSDSLGKALLFLLQGWQHNHPQVVYRAKGLEDWVASGAFAQILAGEYPRDEIGRHQMGRRVTCPICATVVSASVTVCPRCGKNLRGHAGAPTHCGACRADLPHAARYCMTCGAAAGAPPAEGDSQGPESGVEGEEEEPI